ncbi:LYR motif-containing protein 2 isoform X5 [Aquila chrysaetos chrysaetos]|uniref:LYR motif-containing protein 2 isoform X5 n=1 Tax=Aquila chrysaetos chrysaetos TaxID=223781 RepID=UPI001B7D3769|nr:LYR motif-containing protein 2 isoform X5 [Aquila chrysaetos chrysaetos]
MFGQSLNYISLQSTGLHHPFCDMQAYCLLLGCSVYYWSSFAVSEGTQQQARNVPSGTLRKILRAIRDVPAEADRHYLKDWAREEFRRNKDATEEDAIRMMITQGNMQLQELQRTLKLAKS